MLWSTMVMAAEKEFKAALKNSPENQLVLNLDQSDLMIEGYNGNEVLIKVEGDFKEIPERAQGLTPLSRSQDNTGVGLSMKQEGNTLYLQKAIQGRIKITMKVPMEVAVKVQEKNYMDKTTYTLKGLQGDLEINAKAASLKLEEISGPVVAKTVSGDIYCAFRDMKDKANLLHCTTGSLEVLMPEQSAVNLKIRSFNGEVYTDFQIDTEVKEAGVSAFFNLYNFRGTINGGGATLDLQSMESDIYLRKVKQ
ncbi:hypothetical protein PEDI_24030 [Persicobacter diffluens]|uniref:Adhesin domain-containing protein n=2 Tax=Persicobacter diffluens TaxID=981 RepID=A0AAN4VXK7_9BACT|nr:hypothetical protein PEDI_24030 [Persicobacter diffluens]